MAYPFEGKQIYSVTYTNKENDTVELVWNEGTKESPELLSFFGDPSDPSFNKWLTDNDYGHEVIYENTRDMNAADAKNFVQMIQQYADPYVKKMKEEYETNFEKFKKQLAEDYEKSYQKIKDDYEGYHEKIKQDYESSFRQIESEYREKISVVELEEKFLIDLKEKQKLSFEEMKTQLERREMKQSDIIQYIAQNNADEEAIFRAKLSIFEIPSIKNSKDRTLKTNIRKAKSIAELISFAQGVGAFE